MCDGGWLLDGLVNGLLRRTLDGLVNRLLRRTLAGDLLCITSATTSGMEIPEVLAGSDSSLGDDVGILALVALGADVGNVASTYVRYR